ncbi:hypothetical protein ABSA28_00374 [Candidatus Hepatincolaceae symbiont of Richtersius coronifer]
MNIKNMLKGLILLTVLLKGGVLYAFTSFESHLTAKITKTSFDNTRAVLEGYLKNKLTIKAVAFHADVIMDDDSLLYNLNYKADKIKVLYNLYSSVNVGQHTVYLGFMPTLASESFIADFSNNRNKNYLGSKVLSRLKGKDKNDFYIIPSSYLRNNSVFSLSYLYKTWDNRLQFGISYLPNMNNSLTNYQRALYTKNSDSLDGVVIYYNEYQGVGYGLNFAARQHLYHYKIGNQDLDFSLNGLMDFMGFNLKSGYIFGGQETTNLGKIKYAGWENSLYYSFGPIVTGLYSLNSDVKTPDGNFSSWLLEVNLNYQLTKNFTLLSGIYYENFSFDFRNNVGILLGLSIST